MRLLMDHDFLKVIVACGCLGELEVPAVSAKAICHTMSPAMINQLHQPVGGVIANELLPPEFQLRGLIKQAALKITHFEDSPERYLVIAEKSAR